MLALSPPVRPLFRRTVVTKRRRPRLSSTSTATALNSRPWELVQTCERRLDIKQNVRRAFPTPVPAVGQESTSKLQTYRWSLAADEIVSRGRGPIRSRLPAMANVIYLISFSRGWDESCVPLHPRQCRRFLRHLTKAGGYFHFRSTAPSFARELDTRGRCFAENSPVHGCFNRRQRGRDLGDTMPGKIHDKNLPRETNVRASAGGVLEITISLFAFLPARLIEPALVNKDRQLSRYLFM